MSGAPKDEREAFLKRVPVIVRSWDGPNSRIGLEMDLAQMPWGPFDALGKHLSLLLPVEIDVDGEAVASESEVERALRHVEHAAARCREFAQLANGNQELWLRSQRTWEWIRRYLTSTWIDAEVEGRKGPDPETPPFSPSTASESPPLQPPPLPGAAATLRVAAEALRSTPLAVWREAVGAAQVDSPTREEAIQTLLGVARVLTGHEVESSGHSPARPVVGAGESTIEDPKSSSDRSPVAEPDPDQVSFDFAAGYDEGYRMGRKVGLALGMKNAQSGSPRKV